MTDAEKRLLEALNALRDQRFQPFISHLEARREKYLETLSNLDDPVKIHRLQGRIAELKELLGAVAGAAGKLK